MSNNLFRHCSNCNWAYYTDDGPGATHPRIYWCLCSECWRPAIIAAVPSAILGALIAWLVAR